MNIVLKKAMQLKTWSPSEKNSSMRTSCCLKYVQTWDTNYETKCICRVPKMDWIIECMHCSSQGCSVWTLGPWPLPSPAWTLQVYVCHTIPFPGSRSSCRVVPQAQAGAWCLMWRLWCSNLWFIEINLLNLWGKKPEGKPLVKWNCQHAACNSTHFSCTQGSIFNVSENNIPVIYILKTLYINIGNILIIIHLTTDLNTSQRLGIIVLQIIHETCKNVISVATRK